MEVAFSTGGQPTSIVFDPDGNSFIADQGHQAILSQVLADEKIELSHVIKDYDGAPLKGPNSMLLSEKSNTLYFTDSGPMGETSIDNPQGSVFAIDLGLSLLKPVLVGKLAHPCGIALSPEENVLYVAETYKNRILKIVLHSQGVFYSTVFHQFNGRFGPTALAVDGEGLLYVARFDFSDVNPDGLITVLNPSGEVDHELVLPGCAELTGLFFSKTQTDILYATESTSNSLLKILVGSQS